MQDYLRSVPTPSPRVRLKLAQVLIQKLSHPTQGLAVLREIPDGACLKNSSPCATSSTSRPNTCAKKASSSFKTNCGEEWEGTSVRGRQFLVSF